MHVEKTERLAWGLAEGAAASGLSVQFLRKQVREGKLPTQKVGGRVLILDRDFKRFLGIGDEGGQGSGTKN